MNSFAAEPFLSDPYRFLSVTESHSSFMRIRIVEEWLQQSLVDEIFDLGCGDGIGLSTWSKYCKRLTAVDSSSVMIDAARTRNSTLSVRFCARPIEEFRFPKTSSIFVMLGVVEYQKSPLEWLQRTIDRMPNGNTIFCSFPNRGNRGRRMNNWILERWGNVGLVEVLKERNMVLSVESFQSARHAEFLPSELKFDGVSRTEIRYYNFSPLPILISGEFGKLWKIVERLERRKILLASRSTGSGFVAKMTKI